MEAKGAEAAVGPPESMLGHCRLWLWNHWLPIRIPLTSHCVPLGALVFNQIPCWKWVEGENIGEVALTARRGKSWLLNSAFPRPVQKQLSQVGAWVSSHLPPAWDLGRARWSCFL